MKEIKLNDGSFARVDDEHFDYMNQWNWHATKRGEKVYACRTEAVDGQRKGVYMHRQIAELAGMDIAGKHVDHADGNTLNNCSSNLRPATTAENLQNRAKQRNNVSGRKGVYWHHSQKWHAEIVANGTKISLGLFNNKEDAADAYKLAAVKHHGEFARDDDGRLSAEDVVGIAERLAELRHQPDSRNTSGFRGVSRNRKRWQATIQTDGKQRHLGIFDSPAAAALAFDDAAIKLRGDKARVNFPFLL